MDKERETISKFENFEGNRNYNRQTMNKLEGCPEEAIECIELEDFGHVYEKPQGVLKMNILS